MRRVYTAPDALMAGHVRGLLEQVGIRCFIRNQHLWSAMGELPPSECWPEIWVDDGRVELAREVIASALGGGHEPGTPWRCRCGEELEGQFSACWRCGTERPLTDRV
jgi:hypothetical protein